MDDGKHHASQTAAATKDKTRDCMRPIPESCQATCANKHGDPFWLYAYNFIMHAWAPKVFCYIGTVATLHHRPLTKGRITQQSSPERDESNAFSKNVFIASTEDNNLGTEPKFELIWSNG
jgi:hypothetical protein